MEPSPENRVRWVVRRVFILLVVVACLVAVKVAFDRTVTGEEDVAHTGRQGGVVEELTPANGSHAMRQVQIVMDLTADYDGSLEVNGVAIPDGQLLRRPELNQVSFTPGPGKVIEQLPGGRNCVEAEVWRVAQPDQKLTPPIQWCFDAA